MIAQRNIVLGSRKSRLALWQTRRIQQLLESNWPQISCTIEHFETTGDRISDQPLPEIGAKGLFTAELEEGLRSGEIDLAVHSLKDLPVDDAPGLTLGAITSRADVRDVVIAKNGWTLDSLPADGVVGTSSRRRALQIRRLRPDLTVASIRGNVETRVNKVLDGPYDAAILAAAGLQRLEMLDVVTDILSFDQMLPAPGQGALAVQCRAQDAEILNFLRPLDDFNARQATTAERALLKALGGGCSAPVAALGQVLADQRLILTGLVGSPTTGELIQVVSEGSAVEASWLGEHAAAELLRRGADRFLE